MVETQKQAIIQKCKQILDEHYRSSFEGIILFGSTARDQADIHSDIDMLVLLNEPFDYFQELRQIIDLLYPIQLESESLISAKPASKTAFDNGELQLYRNAKREGLLV